MHLLLPKKSAAATRKTAITVLADWVVRVKCESLAAQETCHNDAALRISTAGIAPEISADHLPKQHVTALLEWFVYAPTHGSHPRDRILCELPKPRSRTTNGTAQSRTPSQFSPGRTALVFTCSFGQTLQPFHRHLRRSRPHDGSSHPYRPPLRSRHHVGRWCRSARLRQ